MNMREEFEKYILSDDHYKDFEGTELRRNEDGYKFQSVNTAWLSWQAALKAKAEEDTYEDGILKMMEAFR